MNQPAAIRFSAMEPPAAGEAREIAPGVLWLRLPLPMKLDHVNVYALDEGDGWSVVDTGFNTSRSRDIWAAILSGPLAGRPVRNIIGTHHHPDHIGLAGWFQSVHGAEFWTTRTAWLFARMLVLDVQDRPAPESLLFWRRAGMDAALIAQREGERPFNFADVVAPMPLGYRRLREGQEVAFGGRRWQVRMGNGHAPEHATFWSLDDDLVLGGDQLLPGISPNLGVYPTEPEADPVGEWLESCTRFLEVAEARHLVLPGHQVPFTGLPLRLRQMIDGHLGALKRLVQHLDRPCTAVECFSALFRREIGPSDYGLAMVEAVAHLNHLYQTGQVERTEGPDGAWHWQARAAR
jgi:glyoxylase-like metal-dependent hydrolase (beta-lactamase superfamily II)